MSKLTWLHISDWHQKNEEFDRKVVRDALIADIKNRATRISPEIEKIDFIVFSGDIAFSGKEEEYRKANECFVKPLLEVTGVAPENIFFVSGNHDLDHNSFEYLPEELKKTLDSKEAVQKWFQEGKPCNHLLEPFEGFGKFVSAYEGNNFAASKIYLTQEPDCKKVALLGFNSALMAGRNKNSSGEIDDYGKLVIGEQQIYERLQYAKNENADLIITVFHHPFSWLTEFDSRYIEQRIKQESHFVLCGHQHNQKIEVTHGTDGNYVFIPAGAAYERRDKPYANAYNFVYLDFATNKGIAYLRCWSCKKNEWREDIDSTKTGKYEFAIPNKSKAEITGGTKDKLSHAVTLSIISSVTPCDQYSLDNPVFNIPYRAKEKDVVGRDDELNKVRRQLLEGKRTTIGYTALFHGIGGLGKTQLAVEYAYKYKDEYPFGVIWISADQDIDAQLFRIAVDAKWISSDTQHADILAIAKQRLKTYSDCLIIFDNVEDQGNIIPYIPITTAKPHLLLTSRNVQPGFEPIELEFLNDKLSFTMLMKESGREGNDLSSEEKYAAENIVSKLGGLPLAIEIVGAYLKYLPTCTFSQYNTLLERNIKNALAGDMMASFTKHERDIYRTLQVSEYIFKKSPLLRDVLNLLAWSGTGFMGLSLMASALKKSEEDLLGSVHLGVALRLLNKSKDSGERYEIHRLLRHVWQEQEPLTEDKSEWVNEICTGLGAWFKKYREDFSELKNFELEINHLETWFEHTQRLNLPHTAFLKWLQAYPSYHRGDYASAHKLVLEAMSFLEKNTEMVDSGLEANILNDIGTTYGELGKYKEALAYQEKALEIRRILYSYEHPDTAMSLNNVGTTYEHLRNYEEALKFQNKALEIRKKLFGEMHHHTAQSLNNVGTTYSHLQNHEEALRFQNNALEIQRMLFGQMHPNTATCLDNIGTTYSRLQNHEEALRFHNNALEIKRKLFGEMHPSTAACLDNIGTTYSHLQNHEEALRFQNEALEIRKKLFGEMHPSTSTTLNNIGIEYAELKAYPLAIEYCKKALNINIAMLGKTHSDTISNIRNIVVFFCKLNKFDEAYQQVVQYFKDVPVDDEALRMRKNLIGKIDREAQHSGFRSPSSKKSKHQVKKKRK